MEQQSIRTDMQIIEIVHALFGSERQGAVPTSPKLFEVEQMPIKHALALNDLWHSRLPNLTNWQGCEAYGAFFENVYYAIAIWGNPVAREFNGRGYYELRRMAIGPYAPRNTASRMIKLMLEDIKKRKESVTKVISYQDTAVHHGTIYKASGWVIGGTRKGGKQAWTSNTRKRSDCVATGDKVRWEKDISGHSRSTQE